MKRCRVILRLLSFCDGSILEIMILVITFFTLTKGKITAIAKSAKKSTKRFAGILESLFGIERGIQHRPEKRASGFTGGHLKASFSKHQNQHVKDGLCQLLGGTG